MLSVLIETMNDEDALARTLATLVSGAVEGVVREVIVADAGSLDRTALVAEHAGCVWLENADIVAAIARAKADWLLLLEPGARLDGAWIEAVLRHAGETSGPARFVPSRVGRSNFLTGLFRKGAPLAAGLLITRMQAKALARPGAGAGSIAKGLRPRRLAAEIVTPARR